MNKPGEAGTEIAGDSTGKMEDDSSYTDGTGVKVTEESCEGSEVCNSSHTSEFDDDVVDEEDSL